VSLVTCRLASVVLMYETEHPSFYLHYGDITDMGCLLNVLQTAEFDEIYHLASQSHVGLSFSMPVFTGDVTALGTIRLLQAIVQLKMCGKVKVYNVRTASTSYDATLTNAGMHVGTLRSHSPGRTGRMYSFSSILTICMRQTIQLLDRSQHARKLWAIRGKRYTIQS